MKYYLIMNVIGIIYSLLVGIFSFSIPHLLGALIDIYLFICAYSIYNMNMSLVQEDTSNQTETAITGKAHDQPPSYGSGYEMEGGNAETFQKQNP